MSHLTTSPILHHVERKKWHGRTLPTISAYVTYATLLQKHKIYGKWGGGEGNPRTRPTLNETLSYIVILYTISVDDVYAYFSSTLQSYLGEQGCKAIPTQQSSATTACNNMESLQPQENSTKPMFIRKATKIPRLQATPIIDTKPPR